MRRSNGKNKVFVVVLSLFMIFSSTNTTLFALTETASADKTDAQVEEMAADAELQEENVQEQAENTESTDAVETADEEVATDAETTGEEEAVAEETAAPFKDDNAPVRIGRSALLAAATPGDPEKTEPDTPADPTFITISKTFIGIEEAPADFRIKVDGKAYDLSSAAKYGLSDT